MSTVLITGGSGLIGRALTRHLLDQGYKVRHLSRTPSNAIQNVTTYVWDVDNQQIDDNALDGVDYLVHLAGANVSKRWTTAYKQEIIDSRVNSSQLLLNTLRKNKHNLKAVICPSAVGYYGDRGDAWLSEEDPPGEGFLSDTCEQWESKNKAFQSLGIRTVILRTGLVLSKHGGALPMMALPVRLFVGAPVGTGRQFVPWIYMEDICGIYQKAIEDDSMQGVYNTVAPNPVTNKTMMQKLGEVLKRPILLPFVPHFILRILFGEMSDTILYSVRVSSEKLQEAGYEFRYPRLKPALEEIYHSS